MLRLTPELLGRALFLTDSAIKEEAFTHGEAALERGGAIDIKRSSKVLEAAEYMWLSDGARRREYVVRAGVMLELLDGTATIEDL